MGAFMAVVGGAIHIIRLNHEKCTVRSYAKKLTRELANNFVFRT